MIRINDFKAKTTPKAALLLSVFLLLVAVAGFGQPQQINLTAAPTTTTLPDGTIVPMWGYSCGNLVSSTATCAAANPAAVTTAATATSAAVMGGWSPVVITVPAGTPSAPASLQINLTNSLSFTPTGSTTANTIPTSIVIVGQVGGGLGVLAQRTTTPSPSHANAQGCPTWFIASGATPPGTPCPSPQPGSSGTPPAQGPRVQSMATEVAAGATTSLTWSMLKPGTYLIESGTHPSIQVPMGLIGVLVVTTAPSTTNSGIGTAYPGAAATTTTAAIPAVTYNAELPLEFSEIDPVQNKEVDQDVRTTGFKETNVWSGMTGMCGNPNSPVGVVHTCYPPAVNYTPFYYLINGVAFNKTSPTMSVFPATAGTATTGISTTGTVLVRLVNAGLRMHTPSIVNSTTQGFNGAGASATVGGFALIAEDGNVLPNVAPPGAATAPAAPRVQTDLLMVPSKVYDVMVNVPAVNTTTSITPALPIYARDLALSGNSSVRDAGMLAYISVNNANLSVAANTGIPAFGGFAAAVAVNDTYNSLAGGQPVIVSDPSRGVIANDTNVYGVTLLTPPTNGTVTCPLVITAVTVGESAQQICSNGTFTYTPSSSSVTSDTFTYCANNGYVPASGTTAASCSTSSATVTLGPSAVANGTVTAITQSYTAKSSTFIKIPSPGLLVGNTDSNNLPLNVIVTSAGFTACSSPVTAQCGSLDANGGFTLALPTPSTPPTTSTTVTFNYQLQNSLGIKSGTGQVTVTFPVPSNLTVNVLDAQLYNNCNGNSACISAIVPINDYRWIIEEDKTFWVDPNCTTNSSATTPGCLSAVSGPVGQTSVPTFGVNFHTSNADYVAQGCTGPLSCEGGQTMLCGVNGAPACPAGYAPGSHIPAVCDLGDGACRYDPTGNGSTPMLPSSIALDPAKRYYISVLPGDAANPFPSNVNPPQCSTTGGTSTTSGCGHTMSGAPIPPACNILGGPNVCTGTNAFAPVNVLTLPTPLPTGRLSVIVFEDDFPLNGEQDGGGGNGTVAPIEPGLGGFNIVLWDTYGGLGDVTGQNTYDDFNQPLSNSLAGTIDPVTGKDACPISGTPLTGPAGAGTATNSPQAGGITGMIVTCPKYESDGTTLSPLAGQAVIDHLMPEKFSVQAYPGADRIARGEQWVQTNTLDGQHPHDSFIRIGEPSYFQEYGPAGYHVAIGFANPAIINARATDVCAGNGSPGQISGGNCNNTITGQVDVQRLSRTPDQRLYPSGSRDALAWTQCWVSLGDPDGEDFMFTFCDASGNFKFSNVPNGNWRLTIGDQWNDQIIDGLSTPANVGCTSYSGSAGNTGCTGGQTLALGNIGVQQWQSNLYTRTFIDDNKNGIWDPGEIGIPFIYTMIHYRDGHNSNSLTTDFNGVANFNETFPLFNWYVVESDDTRYKTTGIHTVYDAGGPADGTTSCGTAGGTGRPCGTSTAYTFLANTYESVPLPTDLSVPGAVYCATADCSAEAAGFAAGTPKPSSGSAATSSTGRIDSPWFDSEGWSGLTGQSNYIDFGKAPFASCPPACVTVTSTPAGSTTPTTTQVAENGGIYGQIQYASTRPFEDASQMIQQPWEPYVPHVTVNLYQEGFAADGVTPTLTLVDTTQSGSWDDWAQGFYPNSTVTGGGPKPYMSCPGQGTAANGTPNQDLFFFSLDNQPNYLDWYNSEHNGGTLHALPYSSQYKCYDAMHIWNQLQPAPYDGRYSFPSVLGLNTTTGKPDTTLTGGVGAPVWSNSTQYAVNAVVMYNGTAYTATAVSTGVVPGSAGNTAWTAMTAPPTSFVKASMAGTNCTICVANPDSTDHWRVGTPMLPPGKYVVQVIIPPGYEIYKEEDKNLLIGDNYIAPVTQEFGGLGTDIFIIPDQASVASMYDESASGFNPNNYQDQTTALATNEELSGVPGFPGYQDPLWPCVGEQRVVPDYLSLFPHAQEVAPFAGATRPLCDRKEVTLVNQMSVRVKFALFTSTHIASKYTGVITDDFTSEFDPFSPQFGEKFAPPNMPISTKDYLGNEIARVYSDHWGAFDGLIFSSWEVNPPNITGYSPSMLVQCMNDPGPILDTNTGSPTFGQMIQDPLFNAAYSDFCYEEPYMPGLTSYLDTPVVPTQGFVGAGYNNPDCSYPDATPGIAEVDGDGIGPWVSKSGVTLTITAIGNAQANNSAYSGPSATVAPFNQKTVARHYGFGTQCLSPAAGSTTCNTLSSVTIGGKPAVIASWSDTQIEVAVPSGVPNCTIQQQAQYGGSPAQCGQLTVTAGNGLQSVDSVTVTIGGKTPTHISANQSVQSAIDAAAPGDLLIVDPTCMTTGTAPAITACNAASLHATTPTQTASAGSHSEMLLMWKPVRLQGVGAVSSIINANASPAGKLLDPWRRHVNCLFGLTLQGVPQGAPIPTPTATNPNATTPATYDPTGAYSCPDAGWKYYVGGVNTPQIDRLPLEATVGWDATQNGNLAEQLQEPSLMGAFEGAGVTVLGKGVDFHGAYPWTDGNEGGAFPTGTTLLTGVGPNPTALPVGDANPLCTDGGSGANRFPSNFVCNPSSIDGLTIANSSQGGGGIFAHGWGHHLQIANNRVYNNAGTLTGGISVGQGEFATPYVQGGAANAAPGSCSDGTGFVTNQHLPYCLQLAVNVHNNFITNNSSLGDELFSGTLSGGGGVTFCTGNDYYKFNYNWVCGNLSSGEGGGFVHLGEIQNGDIEHNSFVFNQSQNPTIPTNGGGIQVMGTPDTDPICGTQLDTDCPPGLSDGVGHNLTINANLIQGNMAESGSGGGIRLQQVNGTDISTFFNQPQYWNNVSITNNMIVNNVAGWDGGGISLQDSMAVSIINNTIASNDSLASSGVLTQSIGTPQASAPAGSCTNAAGTASCPQSAGVTSTLNSSLMATSLTGLTVTCPTGQPNCSLFSNPLLQNNVIWQNRSFYIGVGAMGTGTLNQQNLVSLFSANGSAAPTQTASGQCGVPANTSYWDIGVRGDTGAGNHSSGFSLSPTYSVLDDPGYTTGSNLTVNPNITTQYCNGSRVPPECSSADGCGGPSGYGVPPGIVDASTPNPVFSLTPSATVDEGNNWVNVSWGPLSLSNDAVAGPTGNFGGGNTFGNYTLASGSPAIDYIPLSTTNLPTTANPALALDFFGNPRPDAANPNHFDIGAVEFQGGSGVASITSITPSSGAQGTVVNVTITGTGLTLASAVNVSGSGVTVSNVAAVSATTVTATFTIASTATLGARNVTVTTPAGTSAAVTFTVVAPPVPTLTSIAPNSEVRGTAQNVLLTGTNFVSGSNVLIAPAATGVTVSAVTVTSPTTITATITSTTAAAIGNVNVEVTTPGGVSNTLPFAITGPVLTGISPVSANRNTTGLSVVLTGSGLTAASSVNFSGAGITVTSITVNSDTQITATINISAGAAAGARNVTVTGVGGTSNAETFTVTVPPAGLFSIAPNTGARGTTQPVVLTGISLTGATAVNVTGGNITVSGVTVVSDTQVNANFTITPTAALSARNVTVTTPSGTTTPVTFTVVNPGTPIINSLTPASGLRRTVAAANPVAVTITGTNFVVGSTVNVVAPANGLTVTGVAVNAAGTQITATFNTTATATIGPRSITVTNAGGTSNAVTYTVAGPILNSISPTSALRGQGVAIPVVLNGSGLTGTTAVNVSGAGITVGAITVNNDNQVSTSFTVAATAGAGARTVSVTAPGGVSNTVNFTVVIPPTPTLSSIAPPTGTRGSTVPVTLTGTNFVSGETTVTITGGGVTVGAVTVTSPTSLTTSFTISTTAAISVRAVGVTVAGAAGPSNTVPFTVQGPTISSIAPNTGVRGATTTVTFTGTNLTGTTAVTGLGGGVTATIVGTPTSTSVTASLVIAPGAALGIRNLGLTTPIGATNTIPFTVTGATAAISAPAPTLAPATPNTSATEQATITVTNAAAATGPLTLTANPTVTKVGTAGGTFSIPALTPGTCVAGTVVAPGGSCTIIVQYAVTTPGTAGPTATAHVTITGSGMATATMTGANFTAN